MQPPLPPPLTRLRAATDEQQRDDAWAQFVSAFSGVVLYACQRVLNDHDTAMNGYVFVLDALRENECQRLRAYVPREGTSFSTWLLVVARRLALDYYRHRYGRSRSEARSRRAEKTQRRLLEELVGEDIDADSIVDVEGDAPDQKLRRAQLLDRLAAAIATLDARDRLLLTLRFRDGRSVREIAAFVHADSVFHVYRRLDLILRRLRSSLQARGVTDPDP